MLLVCCDAVIPIAALAALAEESSCNTFSNSMENFKAFLSRPNEWISCHLDDGQLDCRLKKGQFTPNTSMRAWGLKQPLGLAVVPYFQAPNPCSLKAPKDGRQVQEPVFGELMVDSQLCSHRISLYSTRHVGLLGHGYFNPVWSLWWFSGFWMVPLSSATGELWNPRIHRELLERRHWRPKKFSISVVNSPDFLGKTPGRRGLNGAGARSDLLRGESTAALDAAQPSAARSEVRFRSRGG